MPRKGEIKKELSNRKAKDAVDALVIPQMKLRETLLLIFSNSQGSEEVPGVHGLVDGLNGLITTIRTIEDRDVQKILMDEAKREFETIVLNNSTQVELMKKEAYGLKDDANKKGKLNAVMKGNTFEYWSV